jgi:hypothetical protein
VIAELSLATMPVAVINFVLTFASGWLILFAFDFYFANKKFLDFKFIEGEKFSYNS